jgi:hypothetical protein
MTFAMGNSAKEVHDQQGAFEWDGLGAGSYSLVARTSDGRVGTAQGLALGEGEQKTGVRIDLQAGAALRGRVVDWNGGVGLAGAVIMGGLNSGHRFTSGADGSFVVDGLAPGASVSMTTIVMTLTARYTADMRDITAPGRGETKDMGTVPLLRSDAGMMAGATRSPLGITTQNREGLAIVSMVAPGSPAAAVAIQPGDHLLTIGGADVSRLGDFAIQQLLDAASSPLAIGLVSGGSGARTVTLTPPTAH